MIRVWFSVRSFGERRVDDEDPQSAITLGNRLHPITVEAADEDDFIRLAIGSRWRIRRRHTEAVRAPETLTIEAEWSEE